MTDHDYHLVRVEIHGASGLIGIGYAVRELIGNKLGHTLVEVPDPEKTEEPRK